MVSSKRKIRGVVIGIILILLIVISLTMFFINKVNNKVDIYTISGESTNFYYSDAMFISSKIKNIYVYGNIIEKTNEVSVDDIIKITFKSDDKLIISSSSLPKQISIENYGYDELFPKSVVNNLDNWYIEVVYKIDNQENTEIIKLNNNYVMNKVKVNPIA